MYSVVLMAALGGGAETPEFGWRHRSSCYSTSCVGYSCTGCTGYSCVGYSCTGCHGYTRRHHLFHGGSCRGCWSSCYGCYGGSYGGYHTRYYSCHGCYGYARSCHGCYSNVSSGYDVGCIGNPVGGYPGTGCYGSSCYGGSAAGSHYPPVAGTPPAQAEPVQPEDMPMDDGEGNAGDSGTESGADGDVAHIVLNVPEGAELYIDGQLIPGEAGPRRFHTPKLRAGQAYFYDVKLVLNEGGRRVERDKRLVVRAGRSVREDFDAIPTDDPRAYASIRD